MNIRKIILFLSILLIISIPVQASFSTSTVTKTCTGLTNGSWCNLTSAINATSGTVNFTNIVIGGGNSTFGSYFYNNPLDNGTRPYQYSLIISNATGTNNATNVFCNGNCNINFTDIRFTLDNTTALPYWIEDNATGKVWVNVTANGTVNMYYGNPSATSASNGTNTFNLFDDFNGASLDTSKWTEYYDLTVQTPGTYTSQSGGIITLNPGAVNQHSTSIVSVKTTLPLNAIITFRTKSIDAGLYPYSAIVYGNGELAYIYGYPHHGLRFANSYFWYGVYNEFSKSVANVPSIIDATSNQAKDQANYHEYSINSKIADVDMTRGGSSYFTGEATNTLTGLQRLSISAGKESNGGGNFYVDYVYVRKYASPEPVWATWGSQQTTQVNVYAQPQNHPTSENKTTSYDNVLINLTLTPGTPIQNIQMFGNWVGTVTATITLQATANATVNEEKALLGYYYNNLTYAPVNDETNITLIIPIINTTFINSQFKGNLNVTGINITSSGYNETHFIINISELVAGSYDYNVTIPYNNAPIVLVDNQYFNPNENVTVVFSAADNESNSLSCYGKLNGIEIESCVSPHDFGIIPIGTYTYYLNVSEIATVGSQWTNVTAIITVFELKPWYQATASANWTGRNAHMSVSFDDKMWVLGGNDGSAKNDVWYSSDGITWYQATASANWSARMYGYAVVYNDKMWVLGGNDGSAKNDVWYSSDGINWIEATSSANWSAKNNHKVIVFDNKMWIMGGYLTNDVWYSADGINWTQATASAEWVERYDFSALVFDNKMWVLGGYDDYNNLNDVWYSNNGVNWTEVTSSANWSARNQHTSLVFDNKMWVLGGYDGNKKNDTWYSSNGIDWIPSTVTANWSARFSHTSIVFNNRMWVIGGWDDSSRKNDVWYSEMIIPPEPLPEIVFIRNNIIYNVHNFGIKYKIILNQNVSNLFQNTSVNRIYYNTDNVLYSSYLNNGSIVYKIVLLEQINKYDIVGDIILIEAVKHQYFVNRSTGGIIYKFEVT